MHRSTRYRQSQASQTGREDIPTRRASSQKPRAATRRSIRFEIYSERRCQNSRHKFDTLSKVKVIGAGMVERFKEFRSRQVYRDYLKKLATIGS